MGKNWFNNLSKEELYMFLQQSHAVNGNIHKVIEDKFSGEDGKEKFKEFITEPERPKLGKATMVPDCCGICKHHGTIRTFMPEMCILHEEWPKKVKFFNVCDSFDISTEVFELYADTSK